MRYPTEDLTSTRRTVDDKDHAGVDRPQVVWLTESILGLS